jgi:hypothetical protein
MPIKINSLLEEPSPTIHTTADHCQPGCRAGMTCSSGPLTNAYGHQRLRPGKRPEHSAG